LGYCPAAGKYVEPGRIKFLRQNPIAPDRGSMCGRVALERRTIHIIDALADPEYTLSQAGHRSSYRTRCSAFRCCATAWRPGSSCWYAPSLSCSACARNKCESVAN
jgi:hypothetical protein